jgi:hypothetical protein
MHTPEWIKPGIYDALTGAGVATVSGAEMAEREITQACLLALER